MRGKTVVALLVLAMSTAGMPPCFAMAMDAMAFSAEHTCCEGAECPASGDEAPEPSPLMPDDGCCALGTLPDPRPPVDRQAATAAVGLDDTLLVSVLWSAPVLEAPPPASAAPGPPCVARHLLLSVLLI